MADIFLLLDLLWLIVTILLGPKNIIGVYTINAKSSCYNIIYDINTKCINTIYNKSWVFTS